MNSGNHRIVRNHLGQPVAVAEIARSAGALGSRPRAHRNHTEAQARQICPSAWTPRLVWRAVCQVLCLAGAWSAVAPQWVHAAPAANALPQGGTVVSGQATIQPVTGQQMVVQQDSQRAILNWQSFDIGSAASVRFVQPSSSASVLNRVLSSTPSQIYGQLSGNGQVIVVNPNGIVVGPSGVVNSVAPILSTNDIANADFLNGNLRFQRGTGSAQAQLINQGQISAQHGGYVALIGTQIHNEGLISAAGGTVALGAGDTVRLPVTSSGRIQLKVDGGTANAIITNASEGSVLAQDGQVYLSAATASDVAVATLRNQGRILAEGDAGGGQVWLTATNTAKASQAQVFQDGQISVNSAQGK